MIGLAQFLADKDTPPMACTGEVFLGEEKSIWEVTVT